MARSMLDLERRAVSVLRKLSFDELTVLDDLLTATFYRRRWPSIGRCVRRAFIIRENRCRLRRAKTQVEKDILRKTITRCKDCSI